MTSVRVIVAPLLGAAVLLVAINAVYVVGQAQQGVLLRLDEPLATVNAGAAPVSAGLHVKWPFVDRVALFDRRRLSLQSEPSELSGSAPTTLQADLRYRIRDPLRFYRALGDARVGARRLGQRLQDSFSRALASATPTDLTNGRPALDNAILAHLRRQAAAQRLGVDILDVRLADAAPSPSTIETVSRRMQDDEARQVGRIKADGEQHKRELLAQADRDAADVRGEAERQALEIRGDGDAQRAAILGDAYGKDPSFARFFRRLEAYDQAFNPDNTTLVLSPDNAFLDLFGHGPGGDRKSPR